MGEAKCLKKSAKHYWKSREIHPKLKFFCICLSLKPHIIQMEKDNSKFQKQSSSFRYYLDFWFADHPSKNTGSPLREAEVKAVKVVNFVAMWLNLYPHTVDSSLNSAFYTFLSFVPFDYKVWKNKGRSLTQLFYMV